MNPEDYEPTMEATALAGQVGSQAQQTAAAQYFNEERNSSTTAAQIECDKILDKARHLLRQDQRIINEDETFSWEAIEENERILTEVGIKMMMQFLECHINKENLLSNYGEEIVNRRMLDACYALNRNILLKYELYFRLPTVEEAIEVLRKRIDDKASMRSFAYETLGIQKGKEEITKEIIAGREKKIEDEIKKIRDEKMQQNIYDYDIIFTELIHMVESITQRAWKGEERGSLRRHTSVSEVVGIPQAKAQDKREMFKWIKG